MPCQVDPVFLKSEVSQTMFDITFLVDVPAVSLMTYTIKAREPGTVNPKYVNCLSSLLCFHLSQSDLVSCTSYLFHISSCISPILYSKDAAIFCYLSEVYV